MLLNKVDIKNLFGELIPIIDDITKNMATHVHVNKLID